MRGSSRWNRSAVWLGVVLGLVICGMPLLALAQFNPPSRGAPGRREGGGTRDICTFGTPDTPSTLIALNPETNFGLTTSEYPRFFWFQPRTRAQTAEFALYQGEVNSSDRTLIYKTTFRLANKAGIASAGIASIALPKSAGLPPLQLGKDYRWSVALICDAKDPSRNITVDGWVQRVQTLGAATRSTDPQARASILAQNGIWFDALEVQTEQRCQNPDRTKGWEELLRSVKLEKIANQPILCWK